MISQLVHTLASAGINVSTMHVINGYLVQRGFSAYRARLVLVGDVSILDEDQAMSALTAAGYAPYLDDARNIFV